jgi:site-specific DNA recombinase
VTPKLSRASSAKGALGVKEVVKWLNRSGYRTRRGDTFGVAGVHRILTNTVYIGQWQFNKTSSRTGQRKPEEEVVTIPVPGLIEPQVFEQVQRQLHARSSPIAIMRRSCSDSPPTASQLDRVFGSDTSR